MSTNTKPKRLVHLPEIELTEGYTWTSVRWLRSLVYGGKLRSYKVGGRVLVDLDDLDIMVTTGERPPT